MGKISNPLYFIDITTYDCYIFRILKVFLVKEEFTRFESVQKAVSDFLDSQYPSCGRKGSLTSPR